MVDLAWQKDPDGDRLYTDFPEVAQMADQQQQPTDSEVEVIDLGTHKKKQVKELQEGTGPLMDDVNSTLGALREAGVIPPDAVPVVFVVKQKRKKRKGGLLDWLI